MSRTEDVLARREILGQIRLERERQHALWGEQNHPSVPREGPEVAFDDGEPSILLCDDSDSQKACDRAFREGSGTWAHIAVEELSEAVYAKDETKRREELVQLAAVCVAWIEAIDRGTTT